MPLYVLERILFALSPFLTLDSIPRSSYYDQHFRQSAALIRARRPFLFRNLATGFALFLFTGSVCT
jgi:hypothetical protein